jgi:hypothetical protein
LYHYSKYPPSYYYSQIKPGGVRIPICSVLVSNVGLWNLAWISFGSPFDKHEDASIPREMKPIVFSDGHQYATNIGKTKVDNKALHTLASTLPAAQLIQAIEQANSVIPSVDAKEWARWLGYAKKRAKQSHDVKCDATAFASAEELTQAGRDDIALHSRLPEPPLPVFTTTEPGKVIDFQRWLDLLKRGTVH